MQASHAKGPSGVVTVLEHRARQGLRISELEFRMQDKPILPAQKQGAQVAPLRVKNIAAALRVPASTVYSEIRSGRLKSYRVGQGRGTIRVSRTAFHAYLDERGIPAEELAVAL